MPRNLDLASLRALVTVAEVGGVTRAAGLLHLTQSAVSMQVKRLEELVGLDLLDRSGRGVSLTPAGEQLVSYARRMLQLNDEAWARLTDPGMEGELVLGVPHDIVYPGIPRVLRRFAAEFPRVRVNLLSSFTLQLKDDFARGRADIILTTEDAPGPGAETLAVSPLAWVGAPGGQAWRARPMRLAFEASCIFRHGVQRRLDEAGIPWEMAVDSASTRTVEATVSADLAVYVGIDGNEPPHLERVPHGGALPPLWSVHVNMYGRDARGNPALAALLDLVRREMGPALAGRPRALAG